MYANAKQDPSRLQSENVKRLGEIEETTALLRNNVDLLADAATRITGRLLIVQRSEPPSHETTGNAHPTPVLHTPLGNELYSIAERLMGLKNLLDSHSDRLET